MLTILVIEDNEDDILYLKSLFDKSKHDYKVFYSHKEEEALNIFKNNSIDCILIDFNLPNWNALRALEMLYNNSDKDYLPVVILTGEHDQKNQAQAARKGAINYITKDSLNTPTQLDEIIKNTMQWSVSLQ